MSFNQNLQAHYDNVEASNIMNSFIKYYIDSELVALKNLITDSAPETLDTLNELAAALNDDPDFFSSMSSANTTLQTNIDNLSTAAADARTALQTALQAAIDAVQADVNQNETDADAAVTAEASARATAITALETSLLAAVATVQSDVDANEADSDAAEAALSARLDVLEADPTTATALAAVQTELDTEESTRATNDAALSTRLDALEADPTTATAVAAVQADVDQNESDADAAIAVERGRIDAILASADANADTFAEIVTLINSVDTENDNAFAAYVLSNDAAVAAVQADVDQNEADSDAAEAALSGRLDTLEADPTTATAVAAVQADVDQNEADADAALALKAPLAGPTFTGDVSFGSLGRVNPSGNELKFLNDTVSSSIVLGNKITLQANTEVELFGDVVFESGLTDAADDVAAAAAGVDVNQLYRNGSVVMIRVS